MTQKTVIAVFTEEQASKLTGVSKRQLRLWDAEGFFVPQHADDDRQQIYSRLYSFRDLVSLRVLNTLRNESRVPLSELRVVKDKLSRLLNDVWTGTTLYVLNKRVVFLHPHTGQREEISTQQGVLQIPLEVVAGNMREAVEAMNRRDDSVIGIIGRNRGVFNSQPVIAGTRIKVSSIKDFHEAGYTIPQILQEYPDLTEKDIQSAIDFVDTKAA